MDPRHVGRKWEGSEVRRGEGAGADGLVEGSGGGGEGGQGPLVRGREAGSKLDRGTGLLLMP